MSAEEVSAPNDSVAAPAPAVENADTGAGSTNDKPKSTASAKKTSARGGKPRSSVPGGKKSGATSGDSKSFETDDVVLARLRGYPPWPARVADIEALPAEVLAQRPGKNPSIYCVQFFPAGDFAWLQSKDLQGLSASDIKSYLSETHRKASGGLREAYETAQDPTEWAIQQSEKQRKAEEAAAGQDVDELEEEDEVPTGSKRKKGVAKKDTKKKKAKGAKSTAEAPESEEESAQPKSKAKPKSSAKSAKKPESKPAENPAPVDDDPLASDPECIKVKDWRHKLQRAFLGKALPTEDEMEGHNNTFNTIENYKDMSIEALQYSKIGKVMKKIATLDNIPRNAEFKITDRAAKLMNEWHDFINSTGGGEAKTNGSAGEATKSEAPVSAAPPAATADADATKEEAKAEENPAEANGNGTKAEAETSA